jgi:hypothetical protein
MIKNLEESEELRSLVEEDKKSPMETPELMELKRMKEYEERLEKKRPHRSQGPAPLFAQGVDDVIQAVQKAEKEQIEVSKLIKELQQRQFKNNQEARRFFGALKVILPIITKTRKPIGWRCYAYNNVHPEGPQGCAKPEAGGEWIFETTTTTEIKEVEI